MDVGSNDVFERQYKAKFELIASQYGEFVHYERDRAARDIGLHFTRKKADGSESVSPSLAWFQLKGLRSPTFSKDEFAKSNDVPITLGVKHLKFWYFLPGPTYLAVYIESVDEFVVCDIQLIVSETWGDDIATLKQATATIRILKKFKLDDVAFYHIRLENEVSAWKDRFNVERGQLKLLLVHYHLIYRLKSRAERSVFGQVMIRDWLSKTRLEIIYDERPRDRKTGWETVWSQWVFMGFANQWRKMFPYLTLLPTSKSGIEPDSDDDDDEFANMFLGLGEVRELQVSQGKTVYGRDEMGECVDFYCRVRLNSLAQRLAACLQTLIDAGFYEVNLNESHWISLASWQDRGI
jgi:hypothetical protein